MPGEHKKMASINFNSLKRQENQSNNYTYADLSLDIQQEPFEFIIGNRVSKGNSRDIKVAYDLNAIKNSIFNLFNTIPGERILLPSYGLDLRQFIFEPISSGRGEGLRNTIYEGIQAWEPRVNVKSVNVDGYMDRHEYEILVLLEIPFLAKPNSFSIDGILTKKGFIYNGR